MVHLGPRPLVICGPSGSGKSTLLRKLFEEFPDRFGFSVSHTTRSPRPGEKDGVHYHFTNKEDMLVAINRGEFIESAVFSGNTYGTSKKAVEDVRRTGRTCVLDIDVQGVKQIRKTDLNPLLVFLKPPSLEELEKRLRSRSTETEEALQKRLSEASAELAYGLPENFHIIIENEGIDDAYARLREFILQHSDDKDQVLRGL